VQLPKLDRILAAEATLQPMLAKAEDLRALAGLLDGFLPPDLASLARVVNYREGEIVLLASTSAAAAKLRMLAPSLVIFFSKQRLQVNSVSIRVQPSGSRRAGAAVRKNAHLSTLSLEKLRKLHESLSDSPAREALGALLARQGLTSREALRPRRAPGSAPARKPRI
jgi:hypothetical protein